VEIFYDNVKKNSMLDAFHLGGLGFDPGYDHVGFVVNKMALGKFPSRSSVFPVMLIKPVAPYSLFIYHR
jgi:hypothetical protein